VTKPSTEIKIPVAWGTLAAKVWGPENGRRVLAFHGWLDNAATFDRLAPLLPPDLRIVSLDLPGHGLSDHRPPGFPYHLVDFTSDVFNAMDALGWKSCALLGHSLGGGIAAICAGVWPERIERTVLIEAIGPMSAPARELPARIGLYLAEFRRLNDKLLPVYATLEDAATARQRVGGISLEASKVLAARGTKEHGGGLTWRSDPRLRLTSPHRLTEDQVEACLDKISCPVLLVRATEGLPIDDNVFQKRTRAIRNLTTRTVPGGHHLHLDAPASFTADVSKFLTE
jgi:pimeloyl-ACP methyl ester carboxylesterase